MRSIPCFLLSVSFSCFIACSPEHNIFNATNGSLDQNQSASCAPIDFAQVQSEIFGAPGNTVGKCLSCHQPGGFLMPLDTYEVVKLRLVQIEDSIRNNRMPKNSPLPDPAKKLLADWIAQGAPEFAEASKLDPSCQADSSNPADPTPNPAPQPVAPTALEPHYESLREKVFAPRCLNCHDSLGFSSSYDFSTYESTVSYTKLFAIPQDGSDSRFVKSLVSGFMPKGSAPLAPEVIEVIRQWVALGMPQKSSDVGVLQ